MELKYQLIQSLIMPKLIIINKLLLNLIKKKNDVFLIDFKKLVFNFGAKNIFDKKLDYIGT